METLTRNTKETQITATLEVYGEGKAEIETKIGFFNHMLESLCKHANWNLQLQCIGDLEVDFHHSVEDCGIVIGSLLKSLLFPIQKIERFGNASIVMDEACVECDLDISNRPFLVFDLELDGKVGDFDCELVEEFFRAVVMNAGISAHIIKKRGKNKHHLIEAAFKAFAVALRRASAKNETLGIPSTKGVL
ncbi:imidazoleglycerol-phosphate dehydratase HisB [Helicobacter sp. MIT 05-5294]|uniref:imidazoleglycerol-phosphate dehydratase HisB n=1 Tax=Helicobacter sp. MIT 05-5294 TaxID=1548150 RepID=UPI00051FC2B6|nr:imidazoleglycerol-phosphate dehydratase HisB [Helicobacter sp. MIT 05-5294]TLD88149.1 imidazoleglycerol-phosphate dehydratase HisB [Helicobacter sp. MIT 05-5294]